MSNQIENKQMTLAQMLANNHLTKIAGDQTITHKTPEAQKSLGKEQTEEINENLEGINAATEAAADQPKDKVQTPPNCQNLNQKPCAAMAETGTSINVMDQTGKSTELEKSASYYKKELAGILGRMNKQAAERAQQEEYIRENFRTGTQVMQKLASLTPNSTEEDLANAKEELLKLASTNPVFQEYREQVLMRKLASEVEELAAAEGISPEEAAEALDAAAAENPEMTQEIEDEATGEAVADLANAEAETDELMQGVHQLAEGASAFTGEEVTDDDIITALEQVQAEADAQGVEPEALIQAAMDELQGQGGDAEVTPEDEAAAQAILEEAAANGISPDEVLQMAAEELGEGGGEAAPEEAAPAEEPPAEGETKEAGFKFSSPRVAYVSSRLHNRK